MNATQVGDQIVEINGENTVYMTHNDAVELIKKAENIKLFIKRGMNFSCQILLPALSYASHLDNYFRLHLSQSMCPSVCPYAVDQFWFYITLT